LLGCGLGRGIIESRRTYKYSGSSYNKGKVRQSYLLFGVYTIAETMITLLVFKFGTDFQISCIWFILKYALPSLIGTWGLVIVVMLLSELYKKFKYGDTVELSLRELSLRMKKK